MAYDVKRDVPVPATVPLHGRVKYPFAAMEPIDPDKKTGDCLEIPGEREAQLALVRMRGFARTHKAKFIAQRVKDRNGKLVKVRIWRTQ